MIMIKRLIIEGGHVYAPVFFQPPAARVGDTIPWQENGEFHLFYRHDVRADPMPGTPWHLVTTADLVHFDDRGAALTEGGFDDADINAYTGSVVRDEDGVHHLFSASQDPRQSRADGLPRQQISHATSRDGMRSWQRHPEHTFGATDGYATANWRDPFVFRDDEAGIWRMLIAARHIDGHERRRGVIAQCISHDLSTWEPVEPFWDPRRYIAYECPEVFAWGDWWYLVYSELSESFATRYRMARSLQGPWLIPDRDTIDGRAYYSAKSAERDGRRLFFGWIASREYAHDDGAWQRSGTMSVLEARQDADGTLAFGLPDELVAGFEIEEPIALQDAVTGVSVPATAAGFALDAPDGYGALVTRDALPDQFYATVRLSLDVGTTECGLLLRTSADGDAGYIVRIEPRRNRMVFDRWTRPGADAAQWQMSGDVLFALELERPCDLRSGEHLLEVVVDGDLCVVTLDRSVSLSTRIYDHPTGRLGLFVGEGGVTFSELGVRTRADS